jgi:hypothetical protein
MAGRAAGNMLTYGEINIVSDSATMEELVRTLDKVMKAHGYPGSVVRVNEDEFEDSGEEKPVLGDEAGVDLVDELAASNDESEKREALESEEDEVVEEETKKMPPWIRRHTKQSNGGDVE